MARTIDERYSQLLAELFARRRFGIELGVERIAAVIDRVELPGPHSVVRVAGTNGKGSTVVMVDAALREAGAKTFRFTSPHLLRFTERFSINGHECSRQDVVSAADWVRRAGGDQLTFFEYCTAMAWVLASLARADVAIMEVGLGGRLDATRALHADVAAVTGVSADHQAHLGDTIDAIAREKAGTFAPNAAAVIGRSGEAGAMATLLAEAARLGADPIRIVELPPAEELELALRGAHQRNNAAVALAVLDELARAGHAAIAPAAWRRGIARATIRGRFERVASNPATYVDGAHNRDAAQRLAHEIACSSRSPKIAVIGLSEDKSPRDVLGPIVQVVDELYLTKCAHPRAADPHRLATYVSGAAVYGELVDAIDAAIERAGASGLVVVAGSLFVAGEALAHLCDEPMDPLVISDP